MLLSFIVLAHKRAKVEKDVPREAEARVAHTTGSAEDRDLPLAATTPHATKPRGCAAPSAARPGCGSERAGTAHLAVLSTSVSGSSSASSKSRLASTPSSIARWLVQSSAARCLKPATSTRPPSSPSPFVLALDTNCPSQKGQKRLAVGSPGNGNGADADAFAERLQSALLR